LDKTRACKQASSNEVEPRTGSVLSRLDRNHQSQNLVLPKPTKLNGNAPIAMIPSGLAEARTPAFPNPMPPSTSLQATLSCGDSVLGSMHSPVARFRDLDSAGILLASLLAAGWKLFEWFRASTSIDIMMNVTIKFQ
jgi:hypothetical protein